MLKLAMKNAKYSLGKIIFITKVKEYMNTAAYVLSHCPAAAVKHLKSGKVKQEATEGNRRVKWSDSVLHC